MFIHHSLSNVDINTYVSIYPCHLKVALTVPLNFAKLGFFP